MTRRLLPLLILLPLAGCSNRPLAAALDCFFPSKMISKPKPPPDNIFEEETRPPIPRDTGPTLPRPDLRFGNGIGRDTDTGLPPIGSPLGADPTLRSPPTITPRESGSPDALPLPNNGGY